MRIVSRLGASTRAIPWMSAGVCVPEGFRKGCGTAWVKALCLLVRIGPQLWPPFSLRLAPRETQRTSGKS